MTDLTPPVERWTSKRKAALVALIGLGYFTEAEALEKYDIGAEELSSWRLLFARGGPKALERAGYGEAIPGDETAVIARAIGEALFGYFDPDEDGPSSPSQQARLAARAVIELLERARAKAD